MRAANRDALHAFSKMKDDAGMILVMGETGVGKSTLVNALKPDSVAVGHNLKSMQAPPRAVQIDLDEEGKSSVTLVDTPGFDDSHRPDSEILAEITEYLAAQYAAGIPLRGIIYLHSIHDNKMKGSSRKYLKIFRSLCGEKALENVLLVTTFWNKVPDSELGSHLRREQELIDDYWAPLQRHGSTTAQFDGSREAAESLVLQLAQNRPTVVLDIQRELVDEQKIISETTAGLGVNERLLIDIQNWKDSLAKINVKLAAAEDEEDASSIMELRKEKHEVENVIKGLEKSQARMQCRIGNEMKERLSRERRKRIMATSLSIFASVLSISYTIVKFAAFGGM